MKVIPLLCAAAGMFSFATASASFISGALTYTGDFAFIGGDDFTDPNVTITFTEIDDFTGSGDLAATNPGVIAVEDLQINPVTIINPIWKTSHAGLTFQLDLDSMLVEFQTENFLVLSGEGDISSNDNSFSPTPASWNFTANQIHLPLGPSLTFELTVFSSSSFAVIPEPAQMIGVLASAALAVIIGHRLFRSREKR